jgi:hypothetical protein
MRSVLLRTLVLVSLLLSLANSGREDSCFLPGVRIEETPKEFRQSRQHSVKHDRYKQRGVDEHAQQDGERRDDRV